MSGKSIFSKSALAVLAVAMATTAIPLEVMAQERQQRGERSGARDGGNGGGGRMWGRSGDAGNRQATQGRPQRVQQQPQTAAAPVQRAAPSTQRVERPATGSWRGTGNVENGARWSREDRGQADRATPQRTTPAPSQIRTPDRPATAQTTPQRGWDGTRWNGTSPGRNNGSSNGNWRDNDRRDDNRNANGSWNGRNQGYADRDRDRNRDYRDRDRNDGRGNSWNGNNGRRDGWNNNNRGDNRRWSNDWRRDNRYDWGRYRAANRGIYRLPSYYAPYRGYGYNRLSIGIFLNSGFYGNNYWINDPWSYRLPPAYGSYRWVRYWNDVILVDTYSGEVVDVIHNFFW